jgi:hypothetical protein
LLEYHWAHVDNKDKEDHMLKRLTSACACAVLLAMTPSTAQAQTFERTTFFTFSDPVMLPGMTLPAGTYTFSLVDDSSSRRVVRVANADGTQTLGLLLTAGANRMMPADDPELHFLETRAGAPLPIKTWWYPGDTVGREFIYSDEEELTLAGRDVSTVMTGTR